MALLLKFIAFPFYPLGLTIFLGIAGIVTLLYSRKYSAILLIIAVSNLLFFSSAPVSRLLTVILERKYLGEQIFPTDVSAIVVLGGGGVSMAYPRMYPEINEAGDRVLHAHRLYKMGVCSTIIATGRDAGHKGYYKTEAEHHAILLVDLGVDSSHIIIEPQAQNTHQHGPFVGAILDSLNLPRKIVLVTSASHMHRSVAVFRKEGFQVFPAATDFNSELKLFTKATDFLPSANSLHRSTVMLHEYYGLTGYKLLGWI